ncbi:MAG: hypothetical protein UY26_C0003G0093 [Candidatus Jorgensenbacteria bacterium GW2011_GWA1_48_13]|uniref:Uncharacterized protein n=2 Tax=Candidatus Joergenseniibacteriota TaxID=1752739 RepID=A0A0G1YJ93_9BACT|nr:MAG: hypothetical protein UY26_C0003G0093 [Candidatus Jorgensenbacteria bacterium GW2011_GWA1_48_13]KKU98593.1 MAG: hypothetical protein UY32_C0020G0001 [Candidatus Jorgensenbacteria bacterium GW2011_GWC1_48_8]KKW15052.1 MAG: hypothetical protein UY55_C0002G0110 [Candidatus Jorgensenbacteria bacterium GW2011_GWB1_50_10]
MGEIEGLIFLIEGGNIALGKLSDSAPRKRSEESPDTLCRKTDKQVAVNDRRPQG